MTTPKRTPRPPPPPAAVPRAAAPADAGPAAGPDGAGPVPAGPVVVEDHLARRIRRPGDLLRFAAACLGIALLVAAGLLAKATTHGVETDVVAASRRLPGELRGTLRFLSIAVLVALPVALAIRQLVRRQARRLAEAVATGVATAGVVGLAGVVLRSGIGDQLYRAIAMSSPGVSHFALLDGYLAGLVAYTTIIDLGGRPRWRNALWLTLAVYAVASLATLRTTVLSVLITLLLGRAIGLGVRYAAGSMSQRPSGEEIAAALGAATLPVTELRRADGPGEASREYTARTRSGERLNVRVFDRDQQAAGAIYRVYRLVRLRGPVSRRAPLSTDAAAERTALLTYAVEDAGVPTPRLRALVRVGPEALALATEEPHGSPLTDLAETLTDAQLEAVWDAVDRLHAHRVAHRSLTADRILFDGAGQVVLLDPGGGDVAATDLQLRLDLSQLLAELAALVGPDRAADLALRKLGPAGSVSLVPLLQQVALARSTRSALRRDKHVLPALRKRLLAAAPQDAPEAPPVQLERVRLRTLVTLVASILAGYLLIVQLGRVDFATLFRRANPLWILVALGLSALTYVAAALSLSGFVPSRLNFVRTMLAQLAGSFITLVTPAAVGGAALNIRYLQRNKVPPAVAAASVGVVQVVAFVLHLLLLVTFVAITGARSHSLRPPTWAYFVIAGLVVAALVVVAVPQGRRLLRARVSPALGQVLPRLLEVLQQPRKLAEGIGGALMLTVCYILCLDTCVRALGGSLPLTSAAVVYLTGSALGSIVPTPGGLGTVEAALAAGLTATGMAAATAVSAVLLFRLLTFWLPVPTGWAAFTYLRRHQIL